MRTVRWFVLVAVAAATACNCGHKGQPPLLTEDSTPNATPNPLDFGNVPIGGSEVLPLKLTDLGELPLEFADGGITIVQGSDAGLAQFTFAPLTNTHEPFGAAVQPGANATVNIQFAPNQGGEQTATLVIHSNSTADPVYNVILKGNGVNVSIVVQPASLDFGNVQVGTSSTLSVTLTNKGSSTSDPITVSAVTGTQAADFGWTGNPIALGPNQSFSLQVTFTPTQQGQASALIPYQYCTSCQPANILLTGEGVDCQLVFAPDPIAFSSVPIGSNVTSGPVMLTNVGTAACQITSLALDTPSTVFTLTGVPALPITLQPIGSTTFGVSYAAATTSDPSDAVDATYVPLDGNGNPVASISPRIASDPITGNGTINPCSLTIAPPAYNFGNVTVGTAVQKTVTVTNTGGEQCSITAIALSSSTDPAFTLTNPAQTSFTLTSGQKQTISVTCDVTVAGSPLLRRGALTFQSTDPSQPNASVPLTAYLQGAGPYTNGWPKWHNDNTDQGLSLSDTSGNQGTVLWQFRVGVPQSQGGLLGSVNPNPTYMNSPVVDEYGNVYQLGMDGTFYGLDPGGNELWNPPKLLPPNPDEHPATPIIAADNTIYIETGTDGASLTSAAQLYHIDAATGAILFQAGPPTGQRCGVGSGGSGGGSGSGNGCDGADGFDVNPSIGNDGMLFDGDDFGQTVAYTLNSGGTFTQTNTVILPFFGERVAVAIDASNNSYWCCLNVCFGVSAPSAGFQQMPAWNANGATIGGVSSTWANSDLAFDESHTGWLMVEGGSQIGSTGNVEIVAMDTTNGSLHWDTKLPSGPTPGSFNLLTEAGIFSSDVGNSSPAIGTDGTVYLGNVDGLYAINGATGAINWTYKPSQDSGANADVDTAPAIGGDGTIFFATAGGTFYAVTPAGKERFHFTTGDRVSSSPAIGPDGTVFIVSDNGQLYAIR